MHTAGRRGAGLSTGQSEAESRCNHARMQRDDARFGEAGAGYHGWALNPTSSTSIPREAPTPAMILVGATIAARSPCRSRNGCTASLQPRRTRLRVGIHVVEGMALGMYGSP